MKEPEVLRELWRITEMRDGCVSGTEYVEDLWLPMTDAKTPPTGYVYAHKSSSYREPTIRSAPITMADVRAALGDRWGEA